MVTAQMTDLCPKIQTFLVSVKNKSLCIVQKGF